MDTWRSAAERAGRRHAAFRRWGLLTVVATLVGLLNFSVTVNDRRAEGVQRPAAYPLMWEMTAAYAFLALLPPLLALIRRFPITRQTYRSRVPLHLLAFLPFSVCHTLLMWGSRTFLYRLLGWGPYDYGDMRYRFPMEAGKHWSPTSACTPSRRSWTTWAAKESASSVPHASSASSWKRGSPS